MTTNLSSILQPDVADGKAYYGAAFVHLAFQCATTFRTTDYLGMDVVVCGCGVLQLDVMWHSVCVGCGVVWCGVVWGKGRLCTFSVHTAGPGPCHRFPLASTGGCNGARIRFPPYLTWPANAGLDKVLNLLVGVKNKFGDALSWAGVCVRHHGASSTLAVAGSQFTLKVVSVGSVRGCPCFYSGSSQT
jgi:catalase (peroxidase I)